MRPVGLLTRIVGLTVQRVGEGMQAVDAGRETTQAFEVFDDDCQGAEDGGEGAGGLDGAPHFQFAREHLAGDDHDRQDDGEEAVRVLKGVEPQLPGQHLAVVGKQRAEHPHEGRHLALLAVVEGDGLGVLAHPHEVEAEVGLALQLREVQADQLAPEHRGREHGGDQGVGQQEVHQAGRDRPQHAGKGDQLDHRGQHDHREVQGLLRERVDVFGDALVGVVDARIGMEPVVGPPTEITRQEVLGEPAAPAQAQDVAHVVVQAVDGHGRREDGRVAPDGGPKAFGVAGSQGRGELAGFVVEEHVEAGLPQQEHDQQAQHACRPPAFFGRAPVRGRDVGKAAPEFGVETGDGSGAHGGEGVQV